MATNFDQLRRQAYARGQQDFERGIPRENNPYKHIAATDERDLWWEAWDNEQVLAQGYDGMENHGQQ